MVCYSEDQEANHATNALLANRAALAQNMNFVRLKTKASDSRHGTQQNELKTAPPNSTVQKVTEPMPCVAWTLAVLSHRKVESPAIGPHRQTYAQSQYLSVDTAAKPPPQIVHRYGAGGAVTTCPLSTVPA